MLVVDNDGTKKYFKNFFSRKLHCEDGPAVERLDGTKEWWIDGVKVADLDKNFDKRYCNKEGKLHREDGPAIERSDGTKEWWIDGVKVADLDKNFDKRYYNAEGKLHREDGPAIEWGYAVNRIKSGRKDWYKNGELHREGGPAIEWPNGGGEWFVHGLRHREYGPAIDYTSQTGYNFGTEWWKDGKQIDDPAVELKRWWNSGVDSKTRELSNLADDSRDDSRDDYRDVYRDVCASIKEMRDKYSGCDGSGGKLKMK